MPAYALVAHTLRPLSFLTFGLDRGLQCVPDPRLFSQPEVRRRPERPQVNESKQFPQGAEFDRLILAAVAKDLEPLEIIQSKISNLLKVSLEVPVSDLVESSLIRLIAEELIAGYLLHAEPPYITPVDVNSGQLENYWFYITEEGKKLLLESEPKSSCEVTPEQSTQNLVREG
jgi:hypothetical protein